MSSRPTLTPKGAEAVVGPAYQLMSIIGQGGQGTVFRAWLTGEAGFRRQVAIKVLNAESAASPALSRRLRDEARLLGMVRHRAIVHVDALVLLEGRQALVMEFVAGPPLHAVLQRGAIPPAAAMELVAELASALHVAGCTPGPSGAPLRLVHRDLKPGNILLTSAGEVKILDFGIARADFVGRESRTRAGPIGTLGYMAPEVLGQGGPVEPSADIYALGIILVEALCARPVGQLWPDPGPYASQVEELLGLCAAVAPSADLGGLLREMIALDPSARPEAREVERRCSALARSLPGPSLRDWAERAVPPVAEQAHERQGLFGTAVPETTPIAVEWSATEASPLPAAPTVHMPPEAPRSSRAGLPWLGLVLLAALTLGAWWLGRRSSPLQEAAQPLSAPSEPPPEPSAPASPPVEPEPAPVPKAAARAARPAEAPVERPPAAAPAPQPKEEALAVLPPPAAAPARVLVSGDALRVEIVSGDRSFGPGAELPAGRYTIYATFEQIGRGPVGEVELQAGQTRSVRCNAVFKECRAD